jgi:pyridoxal phosphate enzyme (YggS family)
VSIAERLRAVRAQIDTAVARTGRAPGSVRLIAVSKTKPAGDVREAYAAGQRDFGENYVQEMLAKATELADLPELRFHLIGHLQRNKVKQALRAASAIHTVDSVRLAEELGRRAAETPFIRPELWSHGTPRLGVLVEVNVGGEGQKSGCEPGDLGAVLDAVETSKALRLVGLMTVPPFTEDPAGARPYFDSLVRLRDEHGGVPRLLELSMGMSHDVEHAILAGATMVRVGRAIFGERT